MRSGYNNYFLLWWPKMTFVVDALCFFVILIVQYYQNVPIAVANKDQHWGSEQASKDAIRTSRWAGKEGSFEAPVSCLPAWFACRNFDMHVSTPNNCSFMYKVMPTCLYMACILDIFSKSTFDYSGFFVGLVALLERDDFLLCQSLQYFDLSSTWSVNFIVTFFYPIGYKKWQKSPKLSSEQDKQHLICIYTIYHEENK